jgi:hypothetical protein
LVRENEGGTRAAQKQNILINFNGDHLPACLEQDAKQCQGHPRSTAEAYRSLFFLESQLPPGILTLWNKGARAICKTQNQQKKQDNDEEKKSCFR